MIKVQYRCYPTTKGPELEVLTDKGYPTKYDFIKEQVDGRLRHSRG